MSQHSICVIMSTYNGAQFLRKQLDDIFSQEGVQVNVIVRDDGSSDGTIDILREYAQAKALTYYSGNNMGAANSFMDAVKNAPEADYYALADQDDIWEKDKLAAAVTAIMQKEAAEGKDKPVLYHSAVYVADGEGNITAVSGTYNQRGFLRGETRPVTGCTAVFNQPLMQLLKRHTPAHFPMHDAWIHNVCLAVNGVVIFDKTPHIRYRQHGNNVVGGAVGVIAAVKRRIKFYKKMENKQKTKMLHEILQIYSDVMPEDNIKRCEMFCSYDRSFGNTVKILLDKECFSGRMLWRLEQSLLVLFRKY